MMVVKKGVGRNGLKFNKKKCAVSQVKKGQPEQKKENIKTTYLKPIKNVDNGSTYKLLGVFEDTKHDDKQALH